MGIRQELVSINADKPWFIDGRTGAQMSYGQLAVALPKGTAPLFQPNSVCGALEGITAALAYGIHQRKAETRFLVFDLGGGTFDVSVLDLFEGVMEVRASAGDNFLGGEDFVERMIEEFFARADLPRKLRDDAVVRQRVAAQAEWAKRKLSEAPQATTDDVTRSKVLSANSSLRECSMRTC